MKTNFSKIFSIIFFISFGLVVGVVFNYALLAFTEPSQDPPQGGPVGVLVPPGMIAMFDTSCPSGWTRFSALDNRFPRGASGYGGTGGYTDAIVVSHGHSVSASMGAAGNHTHSMVTQCDSGCDLGFGVGMDSYWGDRHSAWGGIINAAGNHTHPLSVSVNSAGSSGSGRNIPPYLNMVFCKKN